MLRFTCIDDYLRPFGDSIVNAVCCTTHSAVQAVVLHAWQVLLSLVLTCDCAVQVTPPPSRRCSRGCQSSSLLCLEGRLSCIGTLVSHIPHCIVELVKCHEICKCMSFSSFTILVVITYVCPHSLRLVWHDCDFSLCLPVYH